MTHTYDVRRRELLLAAGAGLLGGTAHAQAFPAKPIRIVVPYSPGGSADVTARVFALKIGQALGGSVLVENVAGANGSIGSAQVARATPDGYTLLLSSVGPQGIMAASPTMKLPYDTLHDFRHVALFGRFPNVLVAGPATKATTIQALIAESKARPGTMSFGSSGNGSTPHLSGELLKVRTGIDAQHVPYKGGGPALLAVIGGELAFTFDNLVTSVPQVRGGKLRALAVTSANRVAALPDTPTMQEAGVTDFVIESWLGLSAPARLPDSIAHALGAAVVGAWKDPATVARLAEIGLEPPTVPPAGFQDFVAGDIQRWRGVFRSSGVKIE